MGRFPIQLAPSRPLTMYTDSPGPVGVRFNMNGLPRFSLFLFLYPTEGLLLSHLARGEHFSSGFIPLLFLLLASIGGYHGHTPASFPSPPCLFFKK